MFSSGPRLSMFLSRTGIRTRPTFIIPYKVTKEPPIRQRMYVATSFVEQEQEQEKYFIKSITCFDDNPPSDRTNLIVFTMTFSSSAIAQPLGSDSDLRRRYGITEEQRNDPIICGDDFLLPYAPSKMWDSQMQRIVRRIGTRATPEQLAVGLVSGYEDFTRGGQLRFRKALPDGNLELLTSTERDAFIVRRLQYYMEHLPRQQIHNVHHTAPRIGRPFRPAFPSQQYYPHAPLLQQLARAPGKSTNC